MTHGTVGIGAGDGIVLGITPAGTTGAGVGTVAGMAGHVLGTLVGAGDGTITTGVEDGIVLVAGMETTIGEITDATIVATTDAVPAWQIMEIATMVMRELHVEALQV